MVMNIELKPIAESKVRQLGGDVCGVLVRKDEKLAAVDEHGRVQWLQGDSEHTAYLEGMNAHLKAELKAARAQGACEWAEQLDACEFHGNDHEVCAEYSGQVPCARAQSGQGVEPEGEERLTDVYRRQLFECQDELNNLRSEYHNRTAELETEIEDLQEELQRVRRQADVPEGWRECLTEMVQAMHDYEMSVDEDAPYKHRAMMDRAHALLSTPTTPQADGWMLSETHRGMRISAEGVLGRVRGQLKFGAQEMLKHLEAMSDAFYSGNVKAVDQFLQTWDLDEKRPQPPAGQEGAQ